jgi:ParB family chromosome partitioning protein
MRNIKYKPISPEMELLAKPGNTGRVAVGIDKSIGEFYFLLLEDLIPFKNQARKYFSTEEINALAESIQKHGVRQPLTVIASEENKGKYEVVSGERRLKAANIAGLKKVPCIILKEKNNADEIALIENIHRQDLHPIELGEALKVLLAKGIFNTQSEMSKKLSLKESVVSECLKLTELSVEIQDYLIKNNIKSRDLLRKISKISSNNNEVKKILGIGGEKRKSFSVIRILYLNDQLNIQSRGIKKLTAQQKETLKEELNKLIKIL